LFISNDKGKNWERLGEGAISGAVNGIVVSPEFSTEPHMLVMLDSALLISRDAGQSWANWKDGVNFYQGTASIAAPHGLDADFPILVGLIGGEVLQI
jgi:photosystem II stability/assembly factor-like uncharacterized protein